MKEYDIMPDANIMLGIDKIATNYSTEHKSKIGIFQ